MSRCKAWKASLTCQPHTLHQILNSHTFAPPAFQVNRMLVFALNTKRLKDRPVDTAQLISEVNIEYCRAMNKIIFDAAVRIRGIHEVEGEDHKSQPPVI